MYTISIGGNALGQLRRFEAAFGTSALEQALLRSAQAAGVTAEGAVSEYPRASGKPLAVYYTRTSADGKTYKSKFKSLKQQRYVMALAADGKIPYRRTGTLGRSITSTAAASGRTAAVRVGTNRTYAKYVIGDAPAPQSHYHQGTWTPLSEDLLKARPDIVTAFVNRLSAEIGKALS